MINYILQYILLFAPFLVHLIHDTPKINSGKTPKHGLNLMIMIAGAIVISLTLQFWAKPEVNPLQYLFLACMIHFAFFNYSLNLLTGKKFFHFGDGPVDRFCKWIISRINLMGYLFVQALLLVIAFFFYHHPNGY